ncbi:hypothetical protein GOODEAATRI_028168, partial [Goodea atripinnis]
LCSVSTVTVRQYHFIYDPKNWTEAQRYCRERNTDLVTVDSLNMGQMQAEFMQTDGIQPGFNGQTVKFVFINTIMNWTDAQRYCRQHYTDLASVRNLQENEQIRTMKPGVIAWIGLYRDTWKWSNGNLYLFHYWASGQPNGETEKCTSADFSLSGQWKDWSCSLKKAFICYLGEI